MLKTALKLTRRFAAASLIAFGVSAVSKIGYDLTQPSTPQEWLIANGYDLSQLSKMPQNPAWLRQNFNIAHLTYAAWEKSRRCNLYNMSHTDLTTEEAAKILPSCSFSNDVKKLTRTGNIAITPFERGDTCIIQAQGIPSQPDITPSGEIIDPLRNLPPSEKKLAAILHEWAHCDQRQPPNVKSDKFLEQISRHEPEADRFMTTAFQQLTGKDIRPDILNWRLMNLFSTFLYTDPLMANLYATSDSHITHPEVFDGDAPIPAKKIVQTINSISYHLFKENYRTMKPVPRLEILRTQVEELFNLAYCQKIENPIAEIARPMLSSLLKAIDNEIAHQPAQQKEPTLQPTQ